MEWHTGDLRRRSEWETGQAGITSSARWLAGSMGNPIVVLTTTPRWMQGGDNDALVVAGHTAGKLLNNYGQNETTRPFWLGWGRCGISHIGTFPCTYGRNQPGTGHLDPHGCTAALTFLEALESAM